MTSESIKRNNNLHNFPMKGERTGRSAGDPKIAKNCYRKCAQWKLINGNLKAWGWSIFLRLSKFRDCLKTYLFFIYFCERFLDLARTVQFKKVSNFPNSQTVFQTHFNRNAFEWSLNVLTIQSYVHLPMCVTVAQKCAGIVWKELNNIGFLQKKEENDNKQEVNIYLMN